MTSLIEALSASAGAAVEDFYGKLSRLPKSRVILEMLDESELQHLKSRQIQNLLSLAEPGLKSSDHIETALRVGRIHAIVGLDKEELVQSRGILAASVYRRIGQDVDNRAMSLFTRRLNDDLTWQLKAYQKIEDAQQSALLEITKLTWECASYADLIHGVIEILSKHEEVAACSIGRPDDDGVFHFEAAAEGNVQEYLAELLASPDTQIVVDADDPKGQGPVGRAWRSGRIERVINYRTHPETAPWRRAALARGLRSCAAVPLRAPGESPVAVLLLHSKLPGGFVGVHQTAFLDMLQTLLGCAIARLGGTHGIREAIPIGDRQHLAALVRSDALLTYYQPLLDPHSGAVTKVEGLARIADGDSLLTPGQFLPALVLDDLLAMYVRGLERALADRAAWLADGLELGLSFNLPPAGLSDIRYFDATCSALERHGFPPTQLTLEVLETEDLSLSHGEHAILSRFKALGVMLAQDDLGSGHSGLARLRQMPFDWIKIDRDMVKMHGDDAIEVLRFVYQLVRLGHAMGKRVVAEGIESTELLDALATLGVDLVQGFAVARPMPAAEVVPWMREHARLHGMSNGAALPQLAKLLVWEERLMLNLDTPKTAEAITRAVDALAGDTRRDDGDGSLVRSLIDFDGLFPDDRKRERVLHEMIDAALHGGPHSAAYESAHRRVVAAITKPRRA
ncbi:EAL domain-containing protein (putative c-di-GMP-specific phosphodiesterase class I) [Paraburkholderia caballeronis]|uniref:EAL domain-containing protein n=1 Tax=Paraburkholderia caballeronis TaxID=416943 RepID=UPI001064AA48|nr:EAL domain-containing protein [Paraburkholderia caballeronis]TDV39425.1 EAL domain-containing protein (putative c-di-GMP-specific phosphodiesterase class I) [Paraburkholderia caballeronis]